MSLQDRIREATAARERAEAAITEADRAEIIERGQAAAEAAIEVRAGEEDPPMRTLSDDEAVARYVGSARGPEAVDAKAAARDTVRALGEPDLARGGVRA